MPVDSSVKNQRRLSNLSNSVFSIAQNENVMTVRKLCTCILQQHDARIEEKNANVEANEKILLIRHHEDGS